MGKFEGILLASDMDGTLLNSAHEVSRENVEAIRFFTEEGGLFTIATGRMIPAIELYTKQLSINAPIIALNGAAIYDLKTRTLLYGKPHDKDVSGFVTLLAGAFPELGIEVVMLDRMYVCRGSEVSRRHCEIIKVPYVLTDVRDVAGACMKMNLTQEPEYLGEVERFISDACPGEYCLVHSDPHYLEVLNSGANKGWGLGAVAEIMEIADERIYAVGDNYNDVEMLKRAAYAFAPANAEPQVKECADAIVSSNDGHALRDVIALLDRSFLPLSTSSTSLLEPGSFLSETEPPTPFA